MVLVHLCLNFRVRVMSRTTLVGIRNPVHVVGTCVPTPPMGAKTGGQPPHEKRTIITAMLQNATPKRGKEKTENRLMIAFLATHKCKRRTCHWALVMWAGGLCKLFVSTSHGLWLSFPTRFVAPSLSASH